MLTTKPYLRTRRPSPTTAEFIVSTRPPLTLSLRILLGLVYLVRFLAALGVLLILSSAWSLSPYSQPTTSSTTTDITTLTYNTYNTNDTSNSNSDSNSSAKLPLSSSSPFSTTPISPPPPPTPHTPLLSLTTTTTTTLTRHLSAIQQHTQPGQLATALAAAVPPLVLIPASLALLCVLLLGRIHAEERLLVLRGLGIQTSSRGGGGAVTARTRFIPTEKIRDVLIGEAFRGFEVRHHLVVVVDGEEDVVVVFPRLLPRPEVLEKVWRGVRGCLWEYDREGGGGGGAGGRRRTTTTTTRGVNGGGNGGGSGYMYEEKDGAVG